MADRALPRGGRLLLTFFGAGLSPVLPGTMGSLATAAVVFAAQATCGIGYLAAALLLAYGVGVTLILGGRAVRPDGRGDPGWVVSDEVAGQALASAAALPWGGIVAHLLALLIFRVLDMTKPGPIRRLEGLPGGPGVLADDVAAGLVAAAIVLAAGLGGAFGAPDAWPI